MSNVTVAGVGASAPAPAYNNALAFEALANGSSGDIEIEKAFLRTLGEQYIVFCAKQRDYGRENIASFGSTGVMVRLADKVARLKNLFRKGASPMNEAVPETWIDIANYGTIGLMCRKGRWPGAWEQAESIGVD